MALIKTLKPDKILKCHRGGNTIYTKQTGLNDREKLVMVKNKRNHAILIQI